jgi:dihydrodipicolinate synthase/N-acetylneuraminate lyase
MDRTDVEWRGYYAALPTPFDADGAIDFVALRATIELFISQGAHGLLVNGSTGEWVAQTLGERLAVAEACVQSVATRVPVIVAVTHGSLTSSKELSRHAEAIGADSIMAPPPPGTRLTRAELHSYYCEVAESTSLPCWLYNFPQENCVNLQVEQIADLIEIPNVVAIKQSSPDQRDLFATIQAFGDRVVVFGDLISRWGLASITGGLGGDGHFGSGMPLGSRMPAFFEHVWRGETEAAAQIADQLATLMSRLRGTGGDDYNWRYAGMQASLKAAMNLMGQPGGLPRKPKLPLADPVALAEMADALRDAGLIVVA